MLKRTLFLVLSFTFVTQLPTYAFDEVAAVNAMAKDLAPLVTTLSRDVTVFHYKSLPGYNFSAKATTDSLRAKEAMAYIARKTNSFWDETLDHLQSNYAVGNGLYTARDPFQSISYYGGYDFGMLAITLPKGTKFINIRKNGNTIELSPETDALNKEVCESSQNRNGIQLYTNEKKCLDLLRKTFKVLQVQAIVYSWAPSYIPWCKDQNDIAISLIDSKQLLPKHINFYSYALSSSSDFNPTSPYYTNAIYSYWLDIDAGATLRDPYHYLQNSWRADLEKFKFGAASVGLTRNEMKSLNRIKTGYNTWKVENLYACTDKYPEDKLPPYRVIPFKPYKMAPPSYPNYTSSPESQKAMHR